VFGSGVVSILLALYLFANISSVSEWALGLLLGIQLLCEGAALTYLAWRIRES
jgi:uncharacterized membrane protein HdeD (DUF308 family)